MPDKMPPTPLVADSPVRPQTLARADGRVDAVTRRVPSQVSPRGPLCGCGHTDNDHYFNDEGWWGCNWCGCALYAPQPRQPEPTYHDQMKGATRDDDV